MRNIGKYLIGNPKLVSKFAWQEWPTNVTAFTDSDWAGCVKTAKSTNGGAIGLGEHVLKAYCRQKKVVALSLAEAELYAIVAVSAETLAMAAYAKAILFRIFQRTEVQPTIHTKCLQVHPQTMPSRL